MAVQWKQVLQESALWVVLATIAAFCIFGCLLPGCKYTGSLSQGGVEIGGVDSSLSVVPSVQRAVQAKVLYDTCLEAATADAEDELDPKDCLDRLAEYSKEHALPDIVLCLQGCTAVRVAPGDCVQLCRESLLDGNAESDQE